MSNETKAKKESKLDIDNNFDLKLVRTLSPALRWILILPINSVPCNVCNSNWIWFHR